MERSSFISTTRSSLSKLLPGNDDKPLLPYAPRQRSRVRIRTLLGHCLYRRVLLWGAACLALICFALVTNSGSSGLRRERLLEFTKLPPEWEGTNETTTSTTSQAGEAFLVSPDSEADQYQSWRADLPFWLRFRHLDGYFVGLKALVPARDHKPEHPRRAGEDSPYPFTLSYTGLPTPTPFVPQPDYKSPEYAAEHERVEPCYLDEDKKVPAPDVYAYDGLVQGQPEPLMGSHSLLGLRDDVCFDRFGRYGAYGLGYSFDKGGLEVGLDTESEGSEAVWAKTGQINYESIDWGDAQNRCYESNKRRFAQVPASNAASPNMASKRPKQSISQSEDGKKKIPRTAVVVRAYTGFPWTYHAVLNFRALISEVALRSGGEYHVHFLLHVRDDNEAIWADPITAQRVLDDQVPPEFHSITTLWSEEQMRLVYPGNFGRSFSNPSNKDIHGVYRSAHMPLQYFALNHPEYTHFWNWELDMRWLGNYYELFDRLAKWSASQSRVGIWERSAKYYIPRYHGDWTNFTSLVERETRASNRPQIFGPQNFPGRVPLRHELSGQNFIPKTCVSRTDTSCGVGEDADLITLNPLFDAENSGWIFSSDVTGYNTQLPPPPRRSVIVTASRLSRRLLMVMHEENWRLHHTMFSEMFPATMALHHGLKAVYAPHPVSVDREWDLGTLDKAFNGGRDHTSGGRGSPFDYANEHYHKGTSWYYHSEFAGLLWRRWLGYAEWDGRGPNGGRAGEGSLRGGKEEEERAGSTGRMCLRSMLVHPIKWEHPSELEEG